MKKEKNKKTKKEEKVVNDKKFEVLDFIDDKKIKEKISKKIKENPFYEDYNYLNSNEKNLIKNKIKKKIEKKIQTEIKYKKVVCKISSYNIQNISEKIPNIKTISFLINFLNSLYSIPFQKLKQKYKSKFIAEAIDICSTETDLNKRLDTNLSKSNQQNEWDFEQLKEDVKTLYINRKSNEARDMMYQYIEDNNEFFCLRFDKKPELYIYKNGIYKEEGETYIKEIISQILGKAYTDYRANKIIERVRVNNYIEPDEFLNKNYPNLIPLKNCIYDLEKDKTRKFSPELIFFNKLQAEYKPDADCPNIKKFFTSIFKTKEDVKRIQELIGYCMYTDMPFEKGFMFYGEGRNGKGKTIELIKRFLGTDNVVNVSIQDLEDEQFQLVKLVNKLANLGADIPRDGLRRTSKFKGITGRDIQTADRKFKNSINFFCYAKQIFSCNELPEVWHPTPAFWDRWEFIIFPYKFIPEYEMTEEKKKSEKFKLQDKDIIEKISTQKELNGLFNWALGGLKRLLKNNQFSNSTTSKEIKSIWLAKSNSFRGFCMKYIDQVEINDKQTYIVQQELDYFYHKFCIRSNLKTVGSKSINRILDHEYSVKLIRKVVRDYDKQILGDITDSSDRAYIWKGIKWKNKKEMLKELLSAEELNKYGFKKEMMTPDTAMQEIKDFLTASQKNHFYIDEVDVPKKIIKKLIREGELYKPKGSEKIMTLD